MKYTVNNIDSCVLKKDFPEKLVCTSKNGKLTILFYTMERILVRYDVNEIKTPSVLEESFKILAEPSGDNTADQNIHFECSENSKFFCIECRDEKNSIILDIDKENANICVKRNGIVVHGGMIGTKDTVLPRNQFRLFTSEANSKIGKGSFLFPLDSNDRFFGLGDKGGVPDRAKRRFRMYNRDSLGFDAEKEDPLYKSIPFFIKQNPITKALCGLYFPVSQSESFDFGCESPFYYSAEISGGPMAYYILLGDNYKQIIQSYCSVTGYPTLPPLFSFGFFGSSMNYVEPDDAQKRMEKYFDDIEKNDIPCEGMYVSSGYLKADDGKRYAFVWNKKKFPDYSSFLNNLDKRGYNLCMNIKPGILTTHPWYKELAEKKFFVKNTDGTPCVVFYWGGEASFIDFNNHDATEWWKSKLKDVFLKHSNCGIWNDNNELELEDPESEAYKTRALFPVLMSKASYEASLEENKHLRPWITCRSGFAGMQKYTRTWTGDNVSDWKTLKYNQFQGWSLGLSGVPFYGHDLGGFFGDIPSMELLIRSCQSAVFQPRFIIHSWRENGCPTEPWTYPEALPIIRRFIYEHYKFMPYIYNCAYESSKSGIPMERPLFLEFSEDTEIPTDSIHCMFGPSILKILVVDEGKKSTKVYLPQKTEWYDVQNQKRYKGGKSIEVDVPLESYEYLAKIPSIIPTAPKVKSLSNGLFNTVEFMLFPDEKEGSIDYTYFEDSGRSIISEKKYNLWKVRLSFNNMHRNGTVELEAEYSGLNDGNENRFFSFCLPDGFKFESSNCTNEKIQVCMALKNKIVYSFTGAYF